MSITEIAFIGIGLAMDAFAVSICKGFSIKNLKSKDGMVVGLYFGVFQALMPFLGYLLGSTFKDLIISIDHWISFIFLTIIGINMIKESNENTEEDNKLDFKTMIILAIATSIDAFAVGVTFAFFEINIINAIIIIGILTFTISFSGVIIGNKFGHKFQGRAEIVGGIILIIIGLRILVEHLGTVLICSIFETFGDGLNLFHF